MRSVCGSSGPQAQESLAAQRRIEASDTGTLQQYLTRYFAD